MLEVVRSAFPELPFDDARVVEDGWDCLVFELDGDWIVRVARRAEVEPWIEREGRLLPELAPVLPVAVPRFERVSSGGVVGVAYRKLVGSPATAAIGERTGVELGRLLKALHGFPVERARTLGVPCFDRTAWREEFARRCDQFRSRVFPHLASDERERAEAVFADARQLDFRPVLLHGDLGPEHVLCRDGRVVGIIDWSDACVGDPALDLAWCLNGTPAEVSRAVARTYSADDTLQERSRFYHRLGPWYEVVHGLETGDQRSVARGLEGVRARLPEP